ncbi:S-layer homology domain-containing protein [Pseudobacteroides cellulosolvens]|uniref:S-layer domain-containing protein n=1 Tax=Pseudobacteroides cellulosolvens ATCC 35603 = DSM 2933 TaxID=398512 RepID=A0A0L6JQK4_9FIRM|nr:S-layer homology domain-containing protein [Pseudobacteroides cellulosolvens]KNY27647.1 S-layer domain-containing protein [Pseudobacteroides cellulosolvens ATCC 35603 = DSM 2933]
MLDSKKIKKACLIAFVFIYISVITAFSQGQAILKVNSGTGGQGEKVKITLILDEPENISGLQFSLKYDKKKLYVKEEDISIGTFLKSWLHGTNILNSDGEIKFAFASSNGIKDAKSIEICSVNFSILSDAEDGKTNIILESVIGGDGTNKIDIHSLKGEIDIFKKSDNTKLTPITPKPIYQSSTTQTPALQTPAPQTSTSLNPTAQNQTPQSNLSISDTPPFTKVDSDKQKPASTSFKDINGHWAQDFIEDLFKRGILLGSLDGRVRPDDYISRAEAIVLLVKSQKLEAAKECTLKFKDQLSLPDWAVGFIQTAFDRALINGYSDNTIRAGNKLTRSEMAVIVMKAFKFPQENKSKLNYKDLRSIPLWAKDYIESAYNLGIITGYSDNTFKPDNYITRGEVIKIISMCLNRSNLD